MIQIPMLKLSKILLNMKSGYEKEYICIFCEGGGKRGYFTLYVAASALDSAFGGFLEGVTCKARFCANFFEFSSIR